MKVCFVLATENCEAWLLLVMMATVVMVISRLPLHYLTFPRGNELKP
jgi:hypothetical protein